MKAAGGSGSEFHLPHGTHTEVTQILSHMQVHTATLTAGSRTQLLPHTRLTHTGSLSHMELPAHTAGHTDGLVHAGLHAELPSAPPATHRNTLTSSLSHPPQESSSLSHAQSISLTHTVPSLIYTLSPTQSHSHTQSPSLKTNRICLFHIHTGLL